MNEFRLASPYEPRGDQPRAIGELEEGIARGLPCQTLLGVTGSGKTFTMANVIARVGRPTLIISHNKTLAAQLYGEFRAYFPQNAVEYFVSYYDYYQPEAYIPATDTYIEKDASINDDLDRLRLRATGSVLSRRDVVVVASVSCIYGIGSPHDFQGMLVRIERGQSLSREDFLRSLIAIQYLRNDYDPGRGSLRVRGDTVEVHPAAEETAVRVEFFGNEIERIAEVEQVTGRTVREIPEVTFYPAKHFVTPLPRLHQAVLSIEQELGERLRELRSAEKLLEAQRLESRTRYDLEMIREVGYCSGIENYSRHLSGRAAGEPPWTLVDYFPSDFLVIMDESHVTLPQLRGMYRGDRSRKETLVEHGFRLPSALDNRPLTFEELSARLGQIVFVSATPSDYELERSGGVVVEQLIRPTGLVDPEVAVRSVAHQIDDLLEEIRRRVEREERVLVTTLTKRMAEDLTEYLLDLGVRVRYLHSDIDAIERVQILRGLRLAEFDVLVGINLLREGLDLPEVSLVAILDADQEGFLRSETSLIQTAGRAARNAGGLVIFYADRMTGSMERALAESRRRREAQLAYNREHGITPQTVVKSREEIMRSTMVADSRGESPPPAALVPRGGTPADAAALLREMEREMLEAADRLEFERAASLRDRMDDLLEEAMLQGSAVSRGARGAVRGAGARRVGRAGGRRAAGGGRRASARSGGGGRPGRPRRLARRVVRRGTR